MREREKKRNHYANSKTCLFYDARPFVLNVKASILPLRSVFDNPSLSQKNRQSSGYLHVDRAPPDVSPLAPYRLHLHISGPMHLKDTLVD